MCKKIFLSLSLIFAAAITLSAQANFTYDFDGNDTPAWADGDALNSGSGIFAQATWVIDDIDGNGTLHAFTDGAYQKAIFDTPNTETFDVGETITLDTRLRLADISAFTGQKSLLRIGLRSTYTNATTEVGLELSANPNANNKFFKINDVDNTGTRTNLTTTDESFHNLSIAITKSATTDQFDVSAIWDSVSTINYTISDPTLYSASRVFAVLDSRQNNVAPVGNNNTLGTHGIWLDSFSSTVVPESSAFASIFGLMALACVASRRKRN